MAKNGLHLITPTSIAYTGTSASISANGSVTFSACSALSLNGVFSADYDNYMIVSRNGCSDASDTRMRLRASGTDASGSNYTYQYLYASSTSVAAGRSTTTEWTITTGSSGYIGGSVTNVYGPYLSQPTAKRMVNGYVGASGLPGIYDYAETHSLSSSYDGFTMFPVSGTITGRIAVYGMRK